MPVDPCLPVPLGGYNPPAAPPIHRIHRIIGRIRHRGYAHHTGFKRGMAPLDGCGRVPAGLPGALPGKGAAPAAFLPKIIPAAAGGAALVGGSGVVGGFGGGGTVPGGTGTIPGGGGGGGNPGCVGVNCTTNPTPVPEPASFILLGVALLVMAFMKPRRSAARQGA